MPLLRVLGGDSSTVHLATALIQAEQRKASETSPKSDSGTAALSKAHDGLRKAEKILIRAKDDRAAVEAKLTKLVTAETKAFKESPTAKALFDAALAKRKPEAEAILGMDMAMLSATNVKIHDKDVTVDTSDENV